MNSLKSQKSPNTAFWAGIAAVKIRHTPEPSATILGALSTILGALSTILLAPDSSRGLAGQAFDETADLVAAGESAFVGERLES